MRQNLEPTKMIDHFHSDVTMYKYKDKFMEQRYGDSYGEKANKEHGIDSANISFL
jgi:hypothetical protein